MSLIHCNQGLIRMIGSVEGQEGRRQSDRRNVMITTREEERRATQDCCHNMRLFSAKLKACFKFSTRRVETRTQLWLKHLAGATKSHEPNKTLSLWNTTHRLLEEEDWQRSDQRHVSQQGLHHHPHGPVKLAGEENVLGNRDTDRKVAHNKTVEKRWKRCNMGCFVLEGLALAPPLSIYKNEPYWSFSGWIWAAYAFVTLHRFQS